METAPGNSVIKGKAVKCVLCGGSLILNSSVFLQHVESKKHKKAASEVEADGHAGLQLHDVFCFAEDYDAHGSDEKGEEEGETYRERLARLDQAIAAGKQKNAENEPKKKIKKKKGERSGGGGGARKKKRPGKRQRLALKEAVGADGEKSKRKKTKK